MSVFKELQPIPLDEYEDCKYPDCKSMHLHRCEFFLEHGATIHQCVINTLEEYEYDMNQNGMEKFVAVISGMLFGIKHNDVVPDVAYGVNCDIKYFETGKYDHLFTKEDLKLIKDDIKCIKEYLDKHPKLLEEEN